MLSIFIIIWGIFDGFFLNLTLIMSKLTIFCLFLPTIFLWYGHVIKHCVINNRCIELQFVSVLRLWIGANTYGIVLAIGATLWCVRQWQFIKVHYNYATRKVVGHRVDLGMGLSDTSKIKT